MNFADILVGTQIGLQPHKSRQNWKKEIKLELLQVTLKCNGMKMLFTGAVFKKLYYASIKTIQVLISSELREEH